MKMLDDIFRRKDVCCFIEEILKDPKYLKKKNSNIKFCDFELSQQCLFIFLDALFKYAIIIEDRAYLDSYIVQIKKIITKIDDYVDINIGVNRVIGSFCALKLGFRDCNGYLEKEKILKYIYDKYIVEGYIFHGFCGVFSDQIARYGMVAEQYQNNYHKIAVCKEIFEKNGLFIIDKDFSLRQLHFTDSFLMSCYYGANAPAYFAKIFGTFYENKNIDRAAYYKNDFFACFDNLNKLMKKYGISDVEKKSVIKICTELWQSLDKSRANISVLMVKRSYLGLNYLDDITKIVYSAREGDLTTAIGKILNARDDDILVTKRIDNSVIKFVEIPNYQALMCLKDEQDRSLVDKSVALEKYENAYGMASALAILGSLLVTLGVIITIIMISWGK